MMARQAQESRIVVWYDPERPSEAVAVGLAVLEGELARLDDSLFRLHARVEV